MTDRYQSRAASASPAKTLKTKGLRSRLYPATSPAAPLSAFPGLGQTHHAARVRFGRTRIEGNILVAGHDITQMDERALREVRGTKIAMIFQEPLTARDPVFTTGQQIA